MAPNHPKECPLVVPHHHRACSAIEVRIENAVIKSNFRPRSGSGSNGRMVQRRRSTRKSSSNRVKSGNSSISRPRPVCPSCRRRKRKKPPPQPRSRTDFGWQRCNFKSCARIMFSAAPLYVRVLRVVIAGLGYAAWSPPAGPVDRGVDRRAEGMDARSTLRRAPISKWLAELEILWGSFIGRAVGSPRP